MSVARAAMHLWVVSETISAQTQCLMDTAERRGHRVVAVQPSACTLALNGSGQALADGLPDLAGLPDLVLARIPSIASDDALHLLRQLDHAGIRCINSLRALEANRNKIKMYAALAAHGLPMPHTVLVMPHKDVALRQHAIATVLKHMPAAPWIVKLPSGSKGQGVMLAESLPALRAMLDTFAALERPVLVQACIAEAMRGDIRVLLVGGKAVAAVERSSSGDEFRSNMALGASGQVLEMNARLRQLAEQAAAVFGLEMAGVDLVAVKDDYLILEVNSCPGFLGMQADIANTAPAGMVQPDLAGLLVDYLEQPGPALTVP